MLLALVISLSFVSSLLMFLTYVLIPDLRKHPGELVMFQCMFQMLLDLLWYAAFLSESFESLCEIVGVVNFYVFYVLWNYLACLGIEIIIKMKNGVSTSYKKRLKTYHLSSHLITLAICIVLASIKGFGFSCFGTCFLADEDSSVVAGSPLVIHLPLMWYSVISTKPYAPHRYRRVLFNYSLVVFALTLSFVPYMSVLAANNFIHIDEDLMVIARALGAFTGFAVAIARLGNKKLLIKIKECFCTHRIFSRNRNRSTSIAFLSDMFVDITQKVRFIQSIVQFLSLAVLRFRTENEQGIYKFSYQSVRSLGEEIGFKVTDSIHKFGIKEYKPEIFGAIRQKLMYENDYLVDVLANPLNFSEFKTKHSGGRSDSFIFTTANELFVIKSITKKEKKVFLRELLDVYTERIIEDPDSRLVRIIGLFRMFPSNQCFIMMENIVLARNSAKVYDLKGSTVDRQCKIENSSINITYKDQDYLDNPIHFNLEIEEREKLYQTILKDFKLLAKLNIMDYSLILAEYVSGDTPAKNRYSVIGENNEVYAIGVIDFFQLYNLSKMTERRFKIIFKRKSSDRISAISADQYYLRFLEFLQGVFSLDK